MAYTPKVMNSSGIQSLLQLTNTAEFESAITELRKIKSVRDSIIPAFAEQIMWQGPDAAKGMHLLPGDFPEDQISLDQITSALKSQPLHSIIATVSRGIMYSDAQIFASEFYETPLAVDIGRVLNRRGFPTPWIRRELLIEPETTSGTDKKRLINKAIRQKVSTVSVGTRAERERKAAGESFAEYDARRKKADAKTEAIREFLEPMSDIAAVGALVERLRAVGQPGTTQNPGDIKISNPTYDEIYLHFSDEKDACNRVENVLSGILKAAVSKPSSDCFISSGKRSDKFRERVKKTGQSGHYLCVTSEALNALGKEYDTLEQYYQNARESFQSAYELPEKTATEAEQRTDFMKAAAAQRDEAKEYLRVLRK